MLGKNFSAGKIAREMGFTRGKVIGRIHRKKNDWGVSLSKPTTYRVQEPKTRLKRVTKAPPLPTPEPVETTFSVDNDLYDSGSFHKPLCERDSELEDNECKWIVNDRDTDGMHLFCGHETEPNESYCPHHKKRSTPPCSPRERKSQ